MAHAKTAKKSVREQSQFQKDREKAYIQYGKANIKRFFKAYGLDLRKAKDWKRFFNSAYSGILAAAAQ